MADLGQAYGAVSAVFSAFAVAGVAAGLLYQNRQLRLARIQTVRGTHRDLLQIAMSDPATYGPAVRLSGWYNRHEHGIEPQQFWYITMTVQYLLMAYETGVVNEASLRAEAFSSIFAGQPGRSWWLTSGRFWHLVNSPAENRFVQILEQEYRKATDLGPPAADTPPDPRHHAFDSLLARKKRALTIAAAVAVAAWLISRRKA